MNHKRKRPKQLRAGCLLCKPNKLGKGMEKKLGHRGFGKLRQEAAAKQDLSDVQPLSRSGTMDACVLTQSAEPPYT